VRGYTNHKYVVSSPLQQQRAPHCPWRVPAGETHTQTPAGCICKRQQYMCVIMWGGRSFGLHTPKVTCIQGQGPYLLQYVVSLQPLPCQPTHKQPFQPSGQAQSIPCHFITWSPTSTPPPFIPPLNLPPLTPSPLPLPSPPLPPPPPHAPTHQPPNTPYLELVTGLWHCVEPNQLHSNGGACRGNGTACCVAQGADLAVCRTSRHDITHTQRARLQRLHRSTGSQGQHNN
jgi:hypothetical protein